jgi:NDP-sugar pyrophosphorylase family protein
LLAAGRGKRQRPYTDATPKPLLPVHGRPSLDFTLTSAARAGIQQACLVTHHLEQQIWDYVGDGSVWNLSAVYCHQPQLAGSADALRAIWEARKEWIPREEPLIVSATDYLLAENALADLVTAYTESGCEIAVSLKLCPPGELSSRSSAELTPDGRVRRIIEKPAPGQAPGPYTAALIYVLPPAIWEYVLRLEPSPRGEFELPMAVDQMLLDGFSAVGLVQTAPAEWSPEMLANRPEKDIAL